MNKKILKGWLICLIGAAFYWYEFLLRIEPSVAVSHVMKQFNIAATGFGLVTALYYYAYTPMQLTVGVLLDRFGTRKMIGLSVIACTLGNLLFTLSSSIFLAGVSRFLIGFGSSFAFVGVLKLGAEWLPKTQFAFLAGFTTSLGMIAGMMGDIFLTSLMKHLSWIEIQNVSTILGLMLIPFIFFFVKDTPSTHTVKMQISLRHTILGLKEILKTKEMWYIGIIANTLYLSLSAFAELWGIKFLENVYALNAEKASFACSMVFLGWLIGGPFIGWFSDWIRSRRWPLLVGGLGAFLSILLVILEPFSMPFFILCLFLFLFGLFSSTEILCFAMSKEINPLPLAATSVAFTNFIVMMGGMIFQPLLGFLLDFSWKGQTIDSVRLYAKTSYQMTFLLIPLAILIGTFFAYRIKETLLSKKS